MIHVNCVPHPAQSALDLRVQTASAAQSPGMVTNHSFLTKPQSNKATVRHDVRCVGRDFTFYSLPGFLIMGHVYSPVVLGSLKGMDSVIIATTHASNVQTRDLTNVVAVAKVN